MIAYSESQSRKSFKIELLVVFAILVSLGFPGNLTRIYGEGFGTLMEYTAFFIEIAAMLLSSGNNWLEIKVINLDKKYVPLYLYVAFIFIESMLVTRFPELEIITVTRLAVTAFFAIWLQEYFSFKRLVELICIAQLIFVILSILFYFAYPGYAYDYETSSFLGLYSTKNTATAELVFGITVTIYLIYQKTRHFEAASLWIVSAVLQILLLLTCNATGPIFCLILVLCMFAIPKYVRMPLGWLFVIGSIAFLFLTLTLMPAFAWFFEAIGKDPTLTERIPLWERIIDVMLREGGNIFTGWGYGMFWRDELAMDLIHTGFDEYSFLGNITTGAHNLIMEFWLNSGLFGLTALFALMIYSTKDINILSNNEYLFVSMFLTYLMVNGFTERAMGGNYAYKDLMFLMVMALNLKRSYEYRISLEQDKIEERASKQYRRKRITAERT